MYLCVCNAITDDQVQWAVEVRGAETVEAVFESLSARPDCQRCEAFLQEAVLSIQAGKPVKALGQEAGTTAWGCRGRCRPDWGLAAPAPVPGLDLAS